MSYFQLRTATFQLPFLIKKSSLKSRYNFSKQVHSVFLAKIMALSLIIVTAEGWGEKEICAKGVSDSKKLAKGWGWGSESIDCTSIMGCITNNTNKITNNRSNLAVDIHCMVHLIHWWHDGLEFGNVVIVEGGGDNWKTQSNTPGVRKKYRLGQGTETEKLFKN